MMPDPNRALLPSLSSHSELVVAQKIELTEMVLDYESRNKYAVYGSNRQPVAYAAEQGKGLWASIMRGVMRHWRSFEIHLFTPDRQLVARAEHPFRWFAFNECLQVHDARGTLLGSIQRRFAFFSKVFEVLSPTGEVMLRVDSGLFSPWSFEFKSGGQRHAVIEKKWSGLLKEMFTDADTFRLVFDNPGLRDDTRWLLIAAAIFVDLQFFEDNQGSKHFSSSSSSSSSDD